MGNPGPSYIALTPGTNLTLSAIVEGGTPLKYQWFHKPDYQWPQPLAGATNATLTLTNVSLFENDAGQYYLEVQNDAGLISSRPVSVEIGYAPFLQFSWDTFDFDPVMLPEPWKFVRVNEGGSALLATHDDGSGEEYWFEWHRNGMLMANATNATLLISNAAPADAGIYSVSATNRFGRTTRSIRVIVESRVRTISSIEVNGPDYPRFQYDDPRNVNLVAGANGTVYLLASTKTEQVGQSWFLAKYAADGTQLWRFDASAAGAVGETFPVGLGLDSNENITVAATDEAGRILLQKLQSNGTLSWATNYPGPQQPNRSVDALAVTAAGETFVSGVDWQWTGAAAELFVLKLASSGELIWQRTIPTTTEHSGVAPRRMGIAALSDGGVCSASRNGLSRLDSTGHQLWQRGTNYESVAVDPAGDIYVTGRGTAKYSGVGERLWTVPNFGSMVQCDTNGAVIASTYDQTHRISADGTVVWSSDVWARAIALGREGETYATSVNTYRLDEAGTEVWQARQPIPHRNPHAAAMALCSDGDVVVAQVLVNYPITEYLLARYRQNAAYPPSPISVGPAIDSVRPGEEVCLQGDFAGDVPLLWFKGNWPVWNATNHTLCLRVDEYREGLYRLGALAPEGLVFSRAVPVSLQRPFLYPPVLDNIGRWSIRALPPRYGFARLESSSDLVAWRNAVPGILLSGGGSVGVGLPADTNRFRFFRLYQLPSE